ncbi:TPA: Na+/H+ antiporter subunit A [Staphylococcus pseudintermedius]|uniref:Na+/H+ antiporter subunit A n=2 Tax=Staphylococcus pseudintermedius TaxID=283734 RepID=UPI0007AE8442|nr:Na+/H+ antiporter subunit A [Staphylococcus pseudintermedius]EGQ0330245.1 Na+/H+ antiporter subunit A [Staphylococcus pseudintermedius]EGQ0363986.1 Na+/H+ antiporter subunit A [Staphylococcus pseudintermedius]EGQ0372333.1 Na+/H+ antiporter subunit A [Staphylococcus pseudintermedius]EGQ1597569.1 Na+/H+ antiporter subunit A [Staphylococcus pseudintermedius]EGQ1734753.1 Na+/H+ antiporter subunit A [Staphylococcus pseudintermedius]
MSWLHMAVLLPLIFAILIPILYRYYKRIHLGWFVLPIPVVLFAYFLSYIKPTMSGQFTEQSAAWMPQIGMNFDVYVDGLGLLFSLLITGIGSLVVLYSISYLSQSEQLGHFYCYLLMFMSAMLGVVLSDNLLVLYFFWELTSFSSFLLISFWRHKDKSLYGAMKSMMITVFGGLSLLGGFILLYLASGTWRIRDIIDNVDQIQTSPIFLLAMIFVIIGAMTKSAQFPFYIWLPDAMEAPTPVSAYLHSATMVKAGIYLIARLTPIFAVSQGWIWAVTAFGLVTLFWGSLNATKQQDLKGILAFSTVSQLGMIMSMLGIGAVSYHFQGDESQLYLAAYSAAIFHLINHATFKGALFMITGAVDHATGTRDTRKLGGLMTIMPISFTLSIITSLSMAGVPPFNGFLSKEAFIESMIEVTHASVFSLNTVGLLIPIVAIVGSIFTFVYSFKFIVEIFLGDHKPDVLPNKAHEASILMNISPAILAGLAILIGLFPSIVSAPLVEPAVKSIANTNEVSASFHLWHGFTPALIATLVIYVVGAVLILTAKRWVPILRGIPNALTLNHWYNQTGRYTPYYATQITRTYMTGFNRNNLVIIFFMMIVLTFVTLIFVPFTVDFMKVSPIRLYEFVSVITITIAAIMIIFARSRLFSIIMLSAVGYSMAIFFIFFNAPDLALTQFVVETISTALFLLCFYHLPNMSRYNESVRYRVVNMIISIGVGAVVIVLGLIAYGNRHFESISEFYKAHVYDLAEGKNMVNVILVDFRGTDTLFESSVLGIAGMGIYTLIKLRAKHKNGYERVEKVEQTEK